MTIIRLRLTRRALFADGALVIALNVCGSVIASMAKLLFASTTYRHRGPAIA
jgi:hypothetical protein